MIVWAQETCEGQFSLPRRSIAGSNVLQATENGPPLCCSLYPEP